MAKSISVKKVKNVLMNRHDEVADALAYANATHDLETASVLTHEKAVILDIAKDLFGGDSYDLVRIQRNLGGVDCIGRYLVWNEEKA